jgi:outer membrane protein OmpA-like peptidoglycan-associated protein
MNRKQQTRATAWAIVGLSSGAMVPPAIAQTAAAAPETYAIMVNSNQDDIAPDNGITLREAIEILNKTLPLDRLSPAERALVTSAPANTIQFSLPPGQTQIAVSRELPAIAVPTVIDGTTQTGYRKTPAIAELPLAKPVVELTAAAGVLVPRGLSIAASNVTVRGLSVYGFSDGVDDTQRTPSADIFIAHRLAPPITTKHPTPANFSPFYADDIAPQNVVIEDSWLGIRPDQSAPSVASTFGVSAFNSRSTVIRRNWIANHEGSAVITAVNAEGLQVTENAITANGLAGMPDGIRLDGKVDRTAITGNLICGNDGAGVYLFKPAGRTEIRNNRITYNGRRFRRASVYLMGNGHTVKDNAISNQAGPGVVVTSYPQSQGNVIENNRFAALEGLSIDLVTQGNVGVQDYQRGDGINPKRNSENRRKDTGNGAVNAPEFATREFPISGGKVVIGGMADPNARIEIYRVFETGSAYGSLGEPLGVATADANGRFSLEATNVQPGIAISAIATDARYGTSEPARNAVIGSATASLTTPVTVSPRCTTPPEAVKPTPPENEETIQTPIVLRIPKNVHFALDRADISGTSAQVLDRIVQVLQENPNITAELQGHTDPRASDAYNLDLGKRRALSVRNYLIRAGIDSSRLTIRSFGERQRRTDGDTRLDYARDRRVELIYEDARNIEVIVQEEDLQLEPGGRAR